MRTEIRISKGVLRSRIGRDRRSSKQRHVTISYSLPGRFQRSLGVETFIVRRLDRFLLDRERNFNVRFAPKAVGRRDRFSTQAGHASDAPGGPSIFGRFALATGPQEIVRMGKMGKGNMRVRTGLPPWLRSADRASLQANSLVLISGNFTGNFTIIGLRDTI